jgi:predicted secreted protein
MDVPVLAGELGDGLAAGVDLCELAEALAARDVGLEQLGVALAAHHAGAGLAVLAPAHAPDGAALALDALDAHGVDPVVRTPMGLRV